MLAHEIPDELEETVVETLDRSELIARVRELERQRSAWELRVRACQERESMYLQFVNDIGTQLYNTYQALHEKVNEQAKIAEAITEAIQTMIRKMEAL